MMKHIFSIILLFFFGVSWGQDQARQPQLIIEIIVDQLRGDLLDRYRSKFGKEGFNYLYNHGIDYHNTHHAHANTVTCAGHAIIATGAYPILHGLISNRWYDRSTNRYKNCVEDSKTPILPTIRTKKSVEGRSPSHLMVSTLSDEIVLAKKGRAFAVSLKDRAAIPLAGHAGKAFWFDKKNGGFISSRHYYQAYPQWVDDWNARYQTKNEVWTLSTHQKNYLYATAPTFTNRYQEFGSSFPHKLGEVNHFNYYKHLSMTPFADELVAEFVMTLLKEEKLGLSAQHTDYLGISFSATDAIGHQFGPNSLESEDNLLRLDKTLSKLLATIDKEVGLDKTLIVFTSDHGVSDAPVYCSSVQMPENPSVSVITLKKNIEKILAKRFALPTQALQAISLPYVYLNHVVIKEHRLSIAKVKRHLTKVLSQQSDIFQAYSIPFGSTDKQTWLSAKVAKMAYAKRCGDIYIVPLPYQGALNPNRQRIAHGTPWQYDTYVPLVFSHPTFKAQRHSRRINTVDIAPTLAFILSIKAPSAALGDPLSEVVEAFSFDSADSGANNLVSKLEIEKTSPHN